MTALATIPPAAIALLHYYERCAKRLPGGLIAPYLDARGIPTIGWGNTRWEDGRPVRMSDPPVSQARADALFEIIVTDFDRKVRGFLPAGAKEEAHAAFLSFAYNAGIQGVENSTALERLEDGNVPGAAEAMQWWTKSAGKVLKGLQRRRRAEALVLMGASAESAILEAGKAFP